MRKYYTQVLLLIFLLPISGVCDKGRDRNDERLVVIILGPTGSGKGTQAEILSKALSLPHISTGDLYRQEVSSNSVLSHLIKYHETVSKEFIPQEIMIGILLKRLLHEDCAKGFILDGFPRSLSRAKILVHYILKPTDRVFLFVLDVQDPQILKDRLSKRIICSACHKQYKLDMLIKMECPLCGSSLMKRPDDTDEKFLMKMKMDFEELDHIKRYLGKRIKVYPISVERETTSELINKQILDILH